ncbi:hypothetical protein MKX07_008194 [Trichoderma sp. CBMAI-0711]|nr:hypothetical protein MKX07_008194 [Trichoderma sp. CBMAI-0711]
MMTFSLTNKNKKVSFAVPIKPKEPALTEDELRSILPASFRNGSAWIGPPHNRVRYFLADDLNMDKLTEASAYLFIVGKVKSPRPLHYQQALGLEVQVSERLDTHLLWANGKIYIKPLPRYVFEPKFWTEYLDCPKSCPYATDFHLLRESGLMRRSAQFSQEVPCEHSKLWKCAMGLVYSYVALIAHESDFAIAKSHKLVPDSLEFHEWKLFVDRMLRGGKLYGQIDERFTYGELDLARLNTVMMLRRPLRYLSPWGGDSDGFFPGHRFSPLPALSAAVATVFLSSEQTKLVMLKLKENKSLILVIVISCLWIILYPNLFRGERSLETRL